MAPFGLPSLLVILLSRQRIFDDGAVQDLGLAGGGGGGVTV